MLGLNGVVVKSHGGTDAQGFAHAVDVAMDMVVHRFNDHIREDLARIAGLTALMTAQGTSGRAVALGLATAPLGSRWPSVHSRRCRRLSA